ncbi:C-C chemokine receptor type 10 [Brienomyrus brachyistius]|uniref:C-C chemokine receptor type 10 n=1 Tax=Brienomyrus brachyistius TaxID=42636 RepID=UPI0020B45B9F|nr:C-C chemokine receptor type 10 [Brienomyrus brachyistius]XP_048870646.1 C-C chemokine receptor type 10 [Brienomyrus brachyistius]
MASQVLFFNMDEYIYENDSYDNGTFQEMCETNWTQKISIKVVQMCIFSVVFLLGFLGNLLVITTFTLYRRLRLRSMTDVFLFNLAVCDMLLLFTIPLQAGDMLLDQWDFGNILCKMTRGLYAINTYSGLLLLACISVDRYVVIVQTHAAQRLRRGQLHYGKLVVLGVWLVSLLLSLPEIIFVSVDEASMQCELQSTWEVRMATRSTQIAGFCLPFLVMLVCYSLIGRTLLRGQGWRQQRTLRLILLLLLVFVLFQLPYTVVLSVKVAGVVASCTQWNATLMAEYVTRSLAYTRCSLNPPLYALVGVRFRGDVQKLLSSMGCLACALCGGASTSPPDSCASTTPTLPTSRSYLTSTSTTFLPTPLSPVLPDHRKPPCALPIIHPAHVKEYITSSNYCSELRHHVS